MRYNLISYLIGDGIKNIGKNKKSTFSAIIIMIITMLTVGICFVIGENAKAILHQMEEGYPINIYISDDATEEDKIKLKEEIKSIEYVNPDNIQYVNKQEAYHEAVRKLGKEQLEGYTENEHPFPEVYIITLTDLSKLDEVVNKIIVLDNVKGTTETDKDKDKENAPNGETQEAQETKEEQQGEQKNKSPAERLTKLNRSVNIAIIVIGGALVVFSMIIIGNTIKLTVHARRKEISIMKYVGATNSFIRWPFLVEGIIIGVIAGLLSVGIVGLVYIGIANQLSATDFLETVHWKLLDFKDMFNLILMVYLGLGIGIGALGSGISMRKYLEV